jgi:hypothetical protein
MLVWLREGAYGVNPGGDNARGQKKKKTFMAFGILPSGRLLDASAGKEG